MNVFRKSAEILSDHKSDESPMSYHNLFGEEFTGETAMDVVDELYNSSIHGGMDATFEEWHAHQAAVWKETDGVKIPDVADEDGAQKFLDILVKIGGLEEGPIENRAPEGPRV